MTLQPLLLPGAAILSSITTILVTLTSSKKTRNELSEKADEEYVQMLERKMATADDKRVRLAKSTERKFAALERRLLDCEEARQALITELGLTPKEDEE